MSRQHAEAVADFDRAYHRAVLGDLLARLRRRPNDLLSYKVRSGLASGGERYRGVRVISVDRIVGSTDRWRDCDRAFRPRRGHAAHRWLSVARADSEGTTLPPVQLYQIRNASFVRDGHHRVSVARARGKPCVDAEVVELLARSPIRLASEDGPPSIDAPGITGALRNLCRRAVVAAGFTANRRRGLGVT